MTMNGIIPSLNTPFKSDGSLDLYSLKRLVNHTVSRGCSGMLGLAFAGEQQTLSKPERIEFIKVVAKENNKRIPLIISVTSSDPETSIELAKLSKIYGAQGVCIQISNEMCLARNIDFLQEISKVSPQIIMVQDLDWSGNGLGIDSIIKMFNQIEKFNWLKIETLRAGPKYTAIKELTKGKLKVCGGWAVTQLLDALNRGVDAFIPTGMEGFYTKIYNQYQSGNEKFARELFYKLLPVLNFTNQHLDISIKFFKELRVKEGLFSNSYCRLKSAKFDWYQEKEANVLLQRALLLCDEYIDEDKHYE